MDIFVLDPATFLPLALVEGYTSMIWTERFIGAGEFEFRTARVAETLQVLAQGALISLRDTNEVMMVETRSISEDDAGNPELVIKGRTLETFLDNRVLVPTVHGVAWAAERPYTIGEMSALLLWNHLVNSTGEDPTRQNWTIDSLTSIPNVVVTETVAVPGQWYFWWFEAGKVYESLTDLLTLGLMGVRAVRPNHTSGAILYFDTSRTDSRGTVTKTPTNDIQQLRMDIYDGLDRTMHQEIVEPVIFHYDAGHIARPEYLFSSQEYKNLAYVISSRWSRLIVPPSTDPGVTGFNRRILFVDAGVLDINDPLAENMLNQKGLTELRKNNMIRLFDGEVSPGAPYQYGKDFFLGDRVTLMAKYGFEETMLVSEYIRTEDVEGDRGYPGLSSIPV